VAAREKESFARGACGAARVEKVEFKILSLSAAGDAVGVIGNTTRTSCK